MTNIVLKLKCNSNSDQVLKWLLLYLQWLASTVVVTSEGVFGVLGNFFWGGTWGSEKIKGDRRGSLFSCFVAFLWPRFPHFTGHPGVIYVYKIKWLEPRVTWVSCRRSFRRLPPSWSRWDLRGPCRRNGVDRRKGNSAEGRTSSWVLRCFQKEHEILPKNTSLSTCLDFEDEINT